MDRVKKYQQKANREVEKDQIKLKWRNYVMDNKSGVKIVLDKERTLIYNLNSLIELEREFETLQNVFILLNEIGNELDDGQGFKRLTEIRYLLTLGLKAEDPDITEEKVGEMVDHAMLPDVLGHIAMALVQSLPDAKKEDDEEKN